MSPSELALEQVLDLALHADWLELQAGAQSVRARLGQSGAQHEVGLLPPGSLAALLSRAALSSSTRHREGTLAHRDAHFWLLWQPGPTGGRAMLRRLSRAPGPLATLGLPEAEQAGWLTLLRERRGLVLLAGPDRSGRHTLQAALARELALRGATVSGAAWAWGRSLPGVAQSVVDPERGLDWAQLLRTLRAQDAEVVLLTDLVHAEAADAVLQLALSGRLVIALMHTIDALSTLSRLLNMGLPKPLLAEALRRVQAQRLLPRMCQACRQPDARARQALDRAGLPESQPHSASGCDACDGQGHQGVVLVTEVLEALPSQADPESAASLAALRAQLRATGVRSLRQRALEQVAAGEVALTDALLLTPTDA